MLLALLLVASLQDQAPNPPIEGATPPVLDPATDPTPPPIETEQPVVTTQPAAMTPAVEEQPDAVVVPPTSEAKRTDAAIRAAFGGLLGTGIGWALGIGALFATYDALGANGGAGALALAGIFFGTPVVVGGLGAFFGALAATRDPLSALLAFAGASVGVVTTLAAGGALYSLQPSGECGPSQGQQFVAGVTLVATPVVAALSGAAGAWLGASGLPSE